MLAPGPEYGQVKRCRMGLDGIGRNPENGGSSPPSDTEVTRLSDMSRHCDDGATALLLAKSDPRPTCHAPAAVAAHVVSLREPEDQAVLMALPARAAGRAQETPGTAQLPSATGGSFGTPLNMNTASSPSE